MLDVILDSPAQVTHEETIALYEARKFLESRKKAIREVFALHRYVYGFGIESIDATLKIQQALNLEPYTPREMISSRDMLRKMILEKDLNTHCFRILEVKGEIEIPLYGEKILQTMK